MEIEILFKRGWSKRKIAKEMGISRNTVDKYLKRKESQRYRPHKSLGKPKKLDNYLNYVNKRFESGLPDFIPATVIFKEIKDMGYCGGITILKDHILKLKNQFKSDQKAGIVRFETPIGKQMQFDWCEIEKNRINAFVATLGYSRLTYVEFTVDQKLSTLRRCFENCFEYIGGIPKEVLFDNMKTVVDKRDFYDAGKHKFNKGFLDFAKHYGFIIRLCKPYRAQTKGKVERFNDYLQRSFYLPLKSSLRMSGLVMDINTANIKVKKWLVEANNRIHATTKERPFDRWHEEKKYLQTLPPAYQIKLPEETKDKKPLVSANPAKESLQHDLLIYQQLLTIN